MCSTLSDIFRNETILPWIQGFEMKKNWLHSLLPKFRTISIKRQSVLKLDKLLHVLCVNVKWLKGNGLFCNCYCKLLLVQNYMDSWLEIWWRRSRLDTQHSGSVIVFKLHLPEACYPVWNVRSLGHKLVTFGILYLSQTSCVPHVLIYEPFNCVVSYITVRLHQFEPFRFITNNNKSSLLCTSF